jgi:hypothetical protein
MEKITKSQIREEQEKKLSEYYEKLMDLPTTTPQTKFFMQLLNTKIAQIEYKEQRSSRQKTGLRLTALTLSTIVTIVLGLNIKEGTPLFAYKADIALIISALVTLLTAIANFWDIDNYWLHVRVMLEKLKLLRYRFAYLLSTTADIPPTETEVNAFMSDFNSIVGDGYWEKLNTKNLVPQEWNNLSEEQAKQILEIVKNAGK